MNQCEFHRADACQCVNGCEWPRHKGKPKTALKLPSSGKTRLEKFELLVSDLIHDELMRAVAINDYQNSHNKLLFLREFLQQKMRFSEYLHDKILSEF
jgi:hypothetical protein